MASVTLISIGVPEGVYGFYVALGSLAGMYLTPDLDVNGRIEVDSLPFGGLVRTIFRPYSLLLPHRSLLSHAPILSTLLRWVWFWVFCIGLGMILGFDISPLVDFLLSSEGLLVLSGLALSDTLHWIRDW